MEIEHATSFVRRYLFVALTLHGRLAQLASAAAAAAGSERADKGSVCRSRTADGRLTDAPAAAVIESEAFKLSTRDKPPV